MKKLYMFCTLLILSAVCFSSCNEKPITQSLTAISDFTEDYFPGFSITDIKKISSISKSPINGEKFRSVPITELGMAKTFEANIPKETNFLMSNDYERTDLVNAYFTQIDSALSSMNMQRKTRSESVIFKVLADELNKISDAPVDKRLVVINSDFMEKSFINFYDSTTMNEIKNHSDRIKRKLIQKYPLNDLTGIEMYFVYLPKDKKDSERFEVLSRFYKKLFESFGAKVEIVGSI